MDAEIISLADRLGNLADNQAAHPAYDGAVIRSMARMPIIRYLGDYDTFCDFQMYTSVREDLSYQVTAQEIADQIRREEITPGDVTQIVNILAAPVAQIDEAYYRKDAALLPRRKQERTTQVLEPLAARLDKTRTLAGPPYNLHRMPIDRFCREVSKLTGDWHYLTVCQDRIMPRLAETRTLFREAVYEISVSDVPERTELLYTILVEPFAALPDRK